MSVHDRPLWTSEEVTHATGGFCASRWQVSGVSIDSRTIEAGDLFVALVGPSHDGQKFVDQAFQSGAAAAIIQSPEGVASELTPQHENIVRVENSRDALEKLAQQARQRTSAKIIAVTGSVGKTGTKEMLRLVLSDQGATTATVGNLNNHFGLPLSLARLPQATEFGVFELGMSSPGEIEPLAKLAHPDVALITAIEYAHSEFFKSIEEIADAKAEIFTGLKSQGIAILNGDNAMIERLSKRAGESGIEDIRVFGEGADADCRLLKLEMTSSSSLAVVDLRGTEIQFELPVPGRHWVQNALGVLCAVDAIGADPKVAAIKLKEMAGLTGRGRHHTLSISGGTFTLIDESYNASPASMKAALEVLGQTQTTEGGRKITVLGDMLELGDMATSLHEDLAEELVANAVDLVFTTGQYMASLSAVLPSSMRGGHTASAQSLSPLVRSVIRPGDVVMVKGSFGSRTGQIVEDLLKLEWNQDDDQRSSLVANGT